VIGVDEVERFAELGAADVVVVSLSATMQPPGWDPETGTLGWAPGAIVCAITPFGLTGPYRDWRATPMVSFAMCGAMRTGTRSGYLAYGANISSFVGLTYANNHSYGTQSDYMTGYHDAVVILAALRSVAETGRGRLHRRRQIDVMAAFMPDLVLDALVNGRDGAPPGNDVAGSLLSGAYRCVGHDEWVVVEVQNLDDWTRLSQWLAVPLDVSSAVEAAELRPVLDAALAGWAAGRTARSTARALQRIGIAAGPVQDMEDLWHDPQLWARHAIVELDSADFGSHYYGECPHRMSIIPGAARWPCLRLGSTPPRSSRTGLDWTTTTSNPLWPRTRCSRRSVSVSSFLQGDAVGVGQQQHGGFARVPR